jgi:hypothetical protein
LVLAGQNTGVLIVQVLNRRQLFSVAVRARATHCDYAGDKEEAGCDTFPKKPSQTSTFPVPGP